VLDFLKTPFGRWLAGGLLGLVGLGLPLAIYILYLQREAAQAMHVRDTCLLDLGAKTHETESLIIAIEDQNRSVAAMRKEAEALKKRRDVAADRARNGLDQRSDTDMDAFVRGLLN